MVSHYNGAYAKYTSFSVAFTVSRESKCVCVGGAFSMSDMEKRFTMYGCVIDLQVKFGIA